VVQTQKQPMDPNPEVLENDDLNADIRKQDHIDLAFKSATAAAMNDSRFLYEPLLGVHSEWQEEMVIFGKTFRLPFWVSSMTGGTEKAARINRVLATVAGKYGFGMGLGSCRSLLYNDEYLSDFAVRKYLGDDAVLFANLGIAQVQQLIDEGKTSMIKTLLDKLEADGLIIHVNPLQEWLQPEGDRYTKRPLDTIKALLENSDYKIIVKEVGQGMGPQSLEALLALPIEGIEFAAFGGTNFAKLELMRGSEEKRQEIMPLAKIGHTAEEMVQLVNHLGKRLGDNMRCRQFIISGGIQNFLDIHYLRSSLNYPSLAGQASKMLRYAQIGEGALDEYIDTQLKGLAFAQNFLRIREDANTYHLNKKL